MHVRITKTEGYAPQIGVQADDKTCKVETVEAWIEQLQIARRWLKRELSKK